MKKVLIATGILLILSFCSVYGLDLEKRVMAGVFVDYGFGFGDSFEEYSFSDPDVGTITVDPTLGFSFGGQVTYGLTENIALSGMVDWIQWKLDISEDYEDFEDLENESVIAINFNGMYLFQMESMVTPFVEAGPGYYIFSADNADSKFGINGGGGIIYMFQEQIGVELGARGHVIFTEDNSTTLVDLRVGLKYLFGRE
ncbi:MAG: outer membrane beta-barrel protein [candidate division Zixibacteria bacterium]|nr:outer membrane beta-barrel protein [candidate division Zixibacteria bacterium]